MEDLDALLADLQTTLHNNSANMNMTSSAAASASTAASHSQTHSVTSHSYHYQDDDVEGNGYSSTPRSATNGTLNGVGGVGVGGGVGSAALGGSGGFGGSQNMQELDTLLEDLNRSRFSATAHSNAAYGSAAGSDGRPSVDALLNELSSAVVQTTEVVSKHNAAAASTATEELDVLMASLSTFKGGANGSTEPIAVSVKAAPALASTDPTYAKPNKVQRAGTKDQLDSMLGNLQADMNKQGISATQKGCCSACDKPIVGQVITALGRTWHPEHFMCTHCRQELGTVNFFERDGQPYCEPDYHNLFSPRCSYCNGPILDKCVTALDQTWHPDHFFCAQCGCQFGEDGFHEKDGKAYCKADYLGMFALKCKGCTMAITEGYISALSAQWHPQCFVCRDCRQPVSGKSFYTVDGRPVCAGCIGAQADQDDDDDDSQ